MSSVLAVPRGPHSRAGIALRPKSVQEGWKWASLWVSACSAGDTVEPGSPWGSSWGRWLEGKHFSISVALQRCWSAFLSVTSPSWRAKAAQPRSPFVPARLPDIQREWTSTYKKSSRSQFVFLHSAYSHSQLQDMSYRRRDSPKATDICLPYLTHVSKLPHQQHGPLSSWPVWAPLSHRVSVLWTDRQSVGSASQQALDTPQHPAVPLLRQHPLLNRSWGGARRGALRRGLKGWCK